MHDFGIECHTTEFFDSMNNAGTDTDGLEQRGWGSIMPTPSKRIHSMAVVRMIRGARVCGRARVCLKLDLVAVKEQDLTTEEDGKKKSLVRRAA